MTSTFPASIIGFMKEYIRRWGPFFLPLGGVLIIIGLQIQISYKIWWVASVFWLLSVASFTTGFYMMYLDYKRAKEQDEEDELLL